MTAEPTEEASISVSEDNPRHPSEIFSRTVTCDAYDTWRERIIGFTIIYISFHINIHQETIAQEFSNFISERLRIELIPTMITSDIEHTTEVLKNILIKKLNEDDEILASESAAEYLVIPIRRYLEDVTKQEGNLDSKNIMTKDIDFDKIHKILKDAVFKILKRRVHARKYLENELEAKLPKEGCTKEAFFEQLESIIKGKGIAK